MNANKNHWYDGWFYDIFIAPNQDKLFRLISELIEPDSIIIDVGCGTGRFSFFMADKCKSVLGIDISEKNINRAKHNLLRYHRNNFTFQHISLEQLISEGNKFFDYAVMTYVLHEMDESERVKHLRNLSAIAGKVIIGDYVFPGKMGFWNILNEGVEFAAGKNHYRNYKNFLANGGIKEIASEAGLKIIHEIKNHPSTSHLVMLSK